MENIINPDIFSIIRPAVWGLFSSFFLSVIIVLTKSWHGKFTNDSTDGVQKFHSKMTPRIGGLGLIFGLLISWCQSLGNNEMPDLFGRMLIAGLPAFFFGIAEDLTKRVGVRERLFGTMVSGFLAWWLLDVSITRVNVWGVDILFVWLPFSVVFTMVAIGGVANAINIIDGFNGLAGGALVISFATLGLIGYQVSDQLIVQICLIMVGVSVGFLLVNFPFGKIFLGDGGAYLMGFFLALVAVMLLVRNSNVSAWAPLLACGYPILEVIFSIKRKHGRYGHHPTQPDKVHLHMLIYRRISRPMFCNLDPAIKNGLTSLFLWPFSFLCGGFACLIYDQTILLFIAFCFVAFCYHLTYFRLTQFKWY